LKQINFITGGSLPAGDPGQLPPLPPLLNPALLRGPSGQSRDREAPETFSTTAKFSHVRSFASRAVLPLCSYGKVLDFMIKKHEMYKKTLDYKSKLALCKNAQKICSANHRHCVAHCKPEIKKTEDSSNACVCTGH